MLGLWYNKSMGKVTKESYYYVSPWLKFRIFISENWEAILFVTVFMAALILAIKYSAGGYDFGYPECLRVKTW